MQEHLRGRGESACPCLRLIGTAEDASGFVKDLLAVPSQEPLNLATIHLTHSALVIRYFIDLVMIRSGNHLVIDMKTSLHNELSQFV